MTDEEKWAQVNTVFALYDENADNLLSVEELKIFVGSLYDEAPTAEELEVQVEQLIITVDKNDDFKISRVELFNSLN
jgi:Ca2+-binding EF-hand superfamily protein